MNKDWILLGVAGALFAGSFIIKDHEIDLDANDNKTPVPAVCSLLGTVISLSEPKTSNLATGTYYHQQVSIKLREIHLISPREPDGHPCTESMTNKTVVTEYQTPVSKRDIPLVVGNYPVKVGDLVLGKAAYAKGYPPLLTDIDFPDDIIPEGREPLDLPDLPQKKLIKDVPNRAEIEEHENHEDSVNVAPKNVAEKAISTEEK